MSSLTVLEPGLSATLQDRGRPGFAHLGVGRSGAADRRRHDLANRRVGNAPSAATVEVLLGGFVAMLDAPRWCAVTGATVGVRIDGRPAPDPALFALRPGERLELTPAATGLRAYLAVEGGLHGAAVLGSESWDSLARHGTPPAAAGTVWRLGDAGGGPAFDAVETGLPNLVAPDVRFAWGPREDRFPAPARAALTGTEWVVGPASDRVGVRLDGAPLGAGTGSLPSEGCVRGAIQVPASGVPIVLLADHPVTGGYPVIGVVDDASCDLLAQLRPGTGLRLQAGGG